MVPVLVLPVPGGGWLSFGSSAPVIESESHPEFTVTDDNVTARASTSSFIFLPAYSARDEQDNRAGQGSPI